LQRAYRKFFSTPSAGKYIHRRLTMHPKLRRNGGR